MRVGATYKQKDSTSESIQLKAKKEVDPNLRNSLTEENGLFMPGALPQVHGIASAGSKQLLDSLEKASAPVYNGKMNSFEVTILKKSKNFENL